MKTRSLMTGLMILAGICIPQTEAGRAVHPANHGVTAELASNGRFNDKLSHCHVPGLDEEVLCGRCEVYEDRAARKGRKIPLKVVLLPAKAEKPAGDPLVYLAGGGVLPATQYAAFFARRFATLRQQRDILLVDQRGTGESNPLPCDLSAASGQPEASRESAYLEAIRRCRKELESKANLKFYSTPIAMDDLDEVRQWLGYSRLNLYGMSYGTKAAQVYLRQHPAQVRVIAMHGVVPLNSSVWNDAARFAQEALDQVIFRCSSDEQCHKAFPNLKQEFSAVLESLSRKPVTVKVVPPGGGQQVEITFDGQDFREFVYDALTSSNGIGTLPLLLDLAYHGDYQPLVQATPLAQRTMTRGPVIPEGVFLSITCAEHISLIDPTTIPEASANTFMGEADVRRRVSTCQEWPRGWLPDDFWTPVKSSIPVLILTGALDVTTPTRYADSVAWTLTNARHLVLPNRSHNDVDPCVSKLIEMFVISGKTEGLDVSCSKDQVLNFATNLEELRKALKHP